LSLGYIPEKFYYVVFLSNVERDMALGFLKSYYLLS